MERMSDCKEWREMLGAFVLGSLHPEGRTAVLAHLDGCAACRDELEELEDARRALESVEIDRVVSSEPPEHLYGEVFSRIGEEQRQIARRRMRVRVGSALAAAAVVVVAVLTVTTRSEGEVVEFASAPQGVHAVAVLTEGAGGIAVHLTVSGLEPGTYGLWMEGYSGTRLSAGTFEVVEGERVEGNFLAGWDRDECAGMGVTVIDGADVFATELPHVTG